MYTWRDVQYSLLARYTVHLDLAIAFDESDVIRVSPDPALVHVILKAKAIGSDRGGLTPQVR